MYVILELNGKIKTEQISNLEYDEVTNEIKFCYNSKPYCVGITKHTGTFIIQIDDEHIICHEKAHLRRKLI